jgi:hypothetical protein
MSSNLEFRVFAARIALYARVTRYFVHPTRPVLLITAPPPAPAPVPFPVIYSPVPLFPFSDR